MTATPLAGTMGAHVRARTVVSLMAGRGAYRLAYQIGNLTLIALWGTATFNGYAAALGICGWFTYIGVAVEKTALKLLPRSRSLVPRLVRLCLVLAIVPVLADLLALAVAGLPRPGARLTLYLVATAWSTSTGLMMVLAALHRLAGRPERDRRVFVTLAIAILASVAATWTLRLPPVGQLALMSASALALVVGLVRALPAGWRRAPAPSRPGPIARSVLRSTIMLGAYDLCGAFSVTAVYAALTIVKLGGQTSQLYLAALASSAASGGLIYLLRVAQPRVSRRQLGVGAAGGRRQARRILVVSAAGGLALAVALGAWAASGHASRSPGLVALSAVTAAEIVLFTIVAYATFLIENTNARALRITSGSAVAGVALTVVLSGPLTATFGAAGAMGTLGLATAGQGVVMSVMLSVRYGRSSRVGARTRKYRRAVASAFATVPYYREWWSETGLGAPTNIEVAERRREDLVPLRLSGQAVAAPDADYGLRALRRLGLASKVRPADRHDPRRGLPVTARVGAVAHDPLLGYLAVFGMCGRWHVAVPDFHAREVPGGVAFTALRSRPFRLVDVQFPAPVGLDDCPEHRTPVLVAGGLATAGAVVTEPLAQVPERGA